MIKTVSLIQRNPELTPEEFRDYWENTHVPMVKAALPGLVHYCGCFPVEDDGPALPGEAYACDAILELGWPDVQTMNRDMSSPEFNTAEREASSARMMDLRRLKTILLEVVDVELTG